MNRIRPALALIVCLLFINSAMNAGEMDAALIEQLDGKRSDELIPVWIKLPQSEALERMRKESEKSPLRAARYDRARSALVAQQAGAQRFLLERLSDLKQNNLADNIKPRWIVNLIEVEVAVSQVRKIAARADVESVFAVPEVRLIHPTDMSPAPSPASPQAVEPNLTYIKADSAWLLGYTGAGRVVCSFDTGIDGDHPALIDSWKGHDGDSAAAWFDPIRNEPFPHTFSAISEGVFGFNVDHGSHTMGTMVGVDKNTGDNYGVAPGAKWISAGVLDLKGASMLDAFEWAANPDGDPNTISDVPDVINHSWGVSNASCINVFYDAIDNMEAMGIVNIFAAGNSGVADSAIANPADRANTDIDMFAVGNIQMTAPATISPTSSRGPSPCNGAIKPNVSAPGHGIVSAINGGGYQSWTGTSMAAPHVSGLVALLRQKNPNVSVDQIKTAILNSTEDAGSVGPDNDFGTGYINCLAALNSIDSAGPAPQLRIYSYDHPPISPGDTVAARVVLKNIGAPALAVQGLILSTDPSLNALTSGTILFGDIGRDDTLSSTVDVEVIVSDTLTAGRIVSLDLEISNMTDPAKDTLALYFLVEPANERMMATHDIGRVNFTVSNFGTYGFGTGSFLPLGGAGFDLDGAGNDLYECALMIGVSPTQVSDGAHNAGGEPDGDFAVLPGGNISISQPGPTFIQESQARFDDSRAENPIGLEIFQTIGTFDTTGSDDFVIAQYIVRNESASTINSAYFGIYLDWDITDGATYANAGGFDPVNSILWTANNNFGTLSRYRAIANLCGPTVGAHTQTVGTIAYQNNNFPNGDGFTEAEKYTALTSGFVTNSLYAMAGTDINQTLTVGPLSLAPGETDTIVWAFLTGNNFNELTSAWVRARQTYGGDCDTVTVGITSYPSGQLPESFQLGQNYPNPFNPTTRIPFSLPRRSEVRVVIYNLLGRELVTLVDEPLSAGSYSVDWDGRNQSGQPVASGVYLYRITADGFAASKKMLLLK
ncbi:MAG: S8 family serine peptidase [bacterium]|nr:S8 family serine peptidase [bacterium]